MKVRTIQEACMLLERLLPARFTVGIAGSRTLRCSDGEGSRLVTVTLPSGLDDLVTQAREQLDLPRV